METTAVVIEVVIGGFQVLVWISLVTMALFGSAWINLAWLKEWLTVIAVALVATAYTLGVIFDEIAGRLLSTLTYKLAKPYVEMSPIGRLLPFRTLTPATMKAEILATRPDVHKHLENLFNQNRLIRATAINLPLITLAALLLVAFRVGLTWQRVLVLLVPLGLIASLAVWAMFHAMRAYFYELGIAYETSRMLRPSARQAPESPIKQTTPVARDGRHRRAAKRSLRNLRS